MWSVEGRSMSDKFYFVMLVLQNDTKILLQGGNLIVKISKLFNYAVVMMSQSGDFLNLF